MSTEKESNSTYIIASSIIVAGLVIAGAVMYSGDFGNSDPSNNQAGDQGSSVEFRPIDSTDHLLGNPEAEIKLVEYSDLECPYCKNFHETLVNEVKADYIDSGKVAWVFRHNPLSVHSKAKTEALASECVAELGGNDAFWAYIDRIFEITPSNNGLDLNQLPLLAGEVDVSLDDFSTCLEEGKHLSGITQEIQEAIRAGALGTPYSLIVKGDKVISIIPGALSGAQIKQALEAALNE